MHHRYPSGNYPVGEPAESLPVPLSCGLLKYQLKILSDLVRIIRVSDLYAKYISATIESERSN